MIARDDCDRDENHPVTGMMTLTSVVKCDCFYYCETIDSKNFGKHESKQKGMKTFFFGLKLFARLCKASPCLGVTNAKSTN